MKFNIVSTEGRFVLTNSTVTAPSWRGVMKEAVRDPAELCRLLDLDPALAELIAQCEARGARQMLAVIGDSANRASIGLHRALGFRAVGLLAASGWKFERWLDVVIMQRELGPGAATAATDGIR